MRYRLSLYADLALLLTRDLSFCRFATAIGIGAGLMSHQVLGSGVQVHVTLHRVVISFGLRSPIPSLFSSHSLLFLHAPSKATLMLIIVRSVRLGSPGDS